MTGVLALAAGLVRLGFLASFISEPVLKGFIVGLALTIIAARGPRTSSARTSASRRSARRSRRRFTRPG